MRNFDMLISRTNKAQQPNVVELQHQHFCHNFLFPLYTTWCSSLWCSHAGSLPPNGFSIDRKVCCYLPLLNIDGYLQVAGGQLEWSTGKYLLHSNFCSSYSPPWHERNQCATMTTTATTTWQQCGLCHVMQCNDVFTTTTTTWPRQPPPPPPQDATTWWCAHDVATTAMPHDPCQTCCRHHTTPTQPPPPCHATPARPAATTTWAWCGHHHHATRQHNRNATPARTTTAATQPWCGYHMPCDNATMMWPPPEPLPPPHNHDVAMTTMPHDTATKMWPRLPCHTTTQRCNDATKMRVPLQLPPLPRDTANPTWPPPCNRIRTWPPPWLWPPLLHGITTTVSTFTIVMLVHFGIMWLQWCWHLGHWPWFVPNVELLYLFIVGNIYFIESYWLQCKHCKHLRIIYKGSGKVLWCCKLAASYTFP
jgi:hypothetical protein